MTRAGATVTAYRVLVTGSRDWGDQGLLGFVLASVAGSRLPDVTLVHGDCPTGADALADDWATQRGLKPERHPADWGRHGRAAGPIRNALMVSLGADVCLAFIKNASRGAIGCADLAEAAGIRTLRYREGQAPARIPPGPALGD
jgi:hypothetical protein